MSFPPGTLTDVYLKVGGKGKAEILHIDHDANTEPNLDPGFDPWANTTSNTTSNTTP